MGAHPIVHIEISAEDAGKSAEFYSEVFDWDITRDDAMDYTMFKAGEVGGGYSPINDLNPAGTVLVYLHTDDLAASMEAVKAHGGEVVMARHDIPTVGAIGMFKDPSGNLLALLQPEGGDA